MPDENVIAGRGIGLCIMSDNHWTVIREYVPVIIDALHNVKPGEVMLVFCGEFDRCKFRTPKP